MDCSVSGYLEKRTTEELCGILNYCLRENNYNSYEYMILEILEILEQRLSLEDLSPAVAQYLTRRLQNDKALKSE